MACISSALFGVLVRKAPGCRTFKKSTIISIPGPDCARDRWQLIGGHAVRFQAKAAITGGMLLCGASPPAEPTSSVCHFVIPSWSTRIQVLEPAELLLLRFKVWLWLGISSVVTNTRSLPCFPDPYPGSGITPLSTNQAPCDRLWSYVCMGFA